MKKRLYRGRDLGISLSPADIFPNVTSSGGVGNFHFRVGVQGSEKITCNVAVVERPGGPQQEKSEENVAIHQVTTGKVVMEIVGTVT